MGTGDPGPNALPPQRPLGPCNTSAGRSEFVPQTPCLWVSKTMWAFHNVLAERRAVLIPAALKSPGGVFLCSAPHDPGPPALASQRWMSSAPKPSGLKGPPTRQRHGHHAAPTDMLCCPQPCVRLEQSPRAVRYKMSVNRPLCYAPWLLATWTAIARRQGLRRKAPRRESLQHTQQNLRS